jgi:hypothetical protein
MVFPERQFAQIEPDSPNQPELTKTLLTIPELRPTEMLEIDERKFFAGNILKPKYRNQAIMFVETDFGQLVPRAFYKSISSGCWRSCPKMEYDGKYSKGLGYHYTQETKPHDRIVDYLEIASNEKRVIDDYPTDIIKKYFNYHQSRAAAECYTYHKEITLYDDKGVLEEFKQYRPSAYWGGSMKYRRNPNTKIDLSADFQKLDFSHPKLKDFLPDFNQDPIKTNKLEHPLLGSINTQTYEARLNSRPIEWIMTYDKDGRIWIDRITFLDLKVNSYGVSPEVIDSGCLTNKPLEYFSQINVLKFGKEYAILDSNPENYADITPLLDNLLPIQLFRKAKGIAKNG